MERVQVHIANSVIEVPNNLEVFVFGSFLKIDKPNDFDLIILYDSAIISSCDIYDYSSLFIESIKTSIGLNIDITYLTKSENDVINFIDEVSAVNIYDCFK